MQLSAGTKVGVDLVSEVVVRVRGQILGLAGIDDAMQHERVEWEQWALANDVFIRLCIAIGNPSLAVAADAGEVVILASAPDGVGVEEPERRCGCASGEIDEDGRLLLPEPFDEVDRRVKVTIKCASGKDFVCISRAIEFELVDVIAIDHFETRILKLLIIPRARERIAVFENFESMLSSVGYSLFFLLIVAAPGREPHADACLIVCGGFACVGEAMGESRVEAPQGMRVIPAIVEEKGIELHMPCNDELLAEGIDSVKRASLIKAVSIAKVKPRVVMQKWLVGAWAFALDISEKCPP